MDEDKKAVEETPVYEPPVVEVLGTLDSLINGSHEKDCENDCPI